MRLTVILRLATSVGSAVGWTPAANGVSIAEDQIEFFDMGKHSRASKEYVPFLTQHPESQMFAHEACYGEEGRP